MKTLYRHKKVLYTLLLAVLLMLCIGMPALAAEGEGAPADEPAQAAQDNSIGSKAIAAAIAVGLAAAGGAVGMGIATAKSAEGISRQPEAEGKIRTAFMLGLVFIETATIYALLVVILIIFVL